MPINTSCEKCGGATRLVGIEPHPRLADTDVWTFECTSCGESAIAAHPLGTAGMTPPATEAPGQTLN
jgi:rRNA maturation protein Nop10